MFCYGGGSGGSFFFTSEDLGRMFDNSFPAFTLFLQVDISSHKLIPFFWPGSVHGGSASWDNYDKVFPDKLRVSSFPDRFPHFARTVA